MSVMRRFRLMALLLAVAVLPWTACRMMGAPRFGFGQGAVSPSAAAPFAFAVLGDLHIDRLEHHDLAYVEEKHGSDDVRQIRDYSRLTEAMLPKLFAQLRETIAASQPPVALIAQAGDLVEGLCGSPQLAHKQCEDAVAMVRAADFGVPFLITKGNHDVTGEGAVEAYNQIILPFIGGQIHQPLTTASYAYEHGNAVFLFFDAYARDSLDWLERTLETRRARHVFVICHPPVVPLGARATWHLYSSPKQQTQRKRLLDVLGRHRAIVFTAHLHQFGVIARRTDTGRFVQVSLNSVVSSPDVRPSAEVSGVARYGPDLVKLEPKFSPETEAQRREALAAEAPFVKHYESANASGYALVRVRGERVEAQVYVGLDRQPWRIVNLTDLIR